MSRPRLVRGLIGAGAFAGLVLLVPIPMRIDLPCILQPRDKTTVFVPTGGQLATLKIKDGEAARPGAVLAELDNPELAKNLRKLNLEAARQERRLELARQAGDAATALDAATQFASAKERIALAETESKRLVLRVPDRVTGSVIAPPRDTELGKAFKAGDTFCTVGVPHALEAFVVVEHGDTALVKNGMRAWVKMRGQTGGIDESFIERMNATVLDELPLALSHKVSGGAVTTQPVESHGKSQEHQAEKPTARSYSLIVPVPHGEAMVPGQRGTVRVDVGWHCLAWRIRRYAEQTFYFRM